MWYDDKVFCIFVYCKMYQNAADTQHLSFGIVLSQKNVNVANYYAIR